MALKIRLSRGGSKNARFIVLLLLRHPRRVMAAM